DAGDVMFDRTFPPPTLSYELDLAQPYAAALLDELCLFAVEKPGCSWGDVTHHDGAAAAAAATRITLACRAIRPSAAPPASYGSAAAAEAIGSSGGSDGSGGGGGDDGSVGGGGGGGGSFRRRSTQVAASGGSGGGGGAIAVVDAATGREWMPPRSGTLRVTLRVTPALPRRGDALCTRALGVAERLMAGAAPGHERDALLALLAADMLVTTAQAQEVCSTAQAQEVGRYVGHERDALLALLAADMLVTTVQAQEMLHILSGAGVPPLEGVRLLWNCIVDPENKFDFMCACVEPARRRDLANLITHEVFKFNWKNPTGHYRLQLSNKYHRAILNTVVAIQVLEMGKGAPPDAPDTSQHRNRSNFRNATLDGEQLALTEAVARSLGARGVLDFDYVSTARPGLEEQPLSEEEFETLKARIGLRQRRRSEPRPPYFLLLLQLQLAAAAHLFTTTQVGAEQFI
ncbi:hypothetical protein JKP88DRAFT_315363, partial [Tribonema minus]